jgi:hypothetical protein
LHSDWELARARGCTTNITYNPIYLVNPTFGLNFNSLNKISYVTKASPKKSGGFVGTLPLVARPPFFFKGGGSAGVGGFIMQKQVRSNNPPFIPPSPRGTSSRVLTFFKGGVHTTILESSALQSTFNMRRKVGLYFKNR